MSWISRAWSKAPKRLVYILGLASAYVLVGKVALLFTLPPGYIAALWPPAGIALAGILLLGYRAWPGVLLGTFLVNLGVFAHSETAVGLARDAIVSFGIASGSTLQALIGAYLVRRSVGKNFQLNAPSTALRVAILGGPVASLVAATLGPTILVTGGVLATAEYAFSCWTWWIGDTMGVLFVTPLLLLSAQTKASHRRRLLPIAVAGMVASCLAIVAFVWVGHAEHGRIQHQFAARARSAADKLDKSLATYVEILHSIVGLYDTQSHITRQQFDTFVRRPLSRHPGIQALEWVPFVPDGERAAFERRGRREGLANFQITTQDALGRLRPSPRRRDYFPIAYVAPYRTNEKALGYDLGSNDLRRAAVEQARDSGHATATAPVKLVQSKDGQRGIVILIPVYKGTRMPSSIAERRRSLRGVVSGVFRIAEVVHSSLGLPTFNDLQLQLIDRAPHAQEHHLYASADEATLAANSQTRHRSTDLRAWFATAETLEIGGRRWVAHFTAMPALVAGRRSWLPWAVLGGGLIFSGLLTIFMLMLTVRAAPLEPKPLVSEKATGRPVDHDDNSTSSSHASSATRPSGRRPRKRSPRQAPATG